MEVMFAVVILALGLVFVACQFPVGLFAARDVADATNSVINNHNTKIMTEIKLQAVQEFDLATFNALVNTDGNVHLLVKANVLWDLSSVVLDNPEDVFILLPSYPLYPDMSPYIWIVTPPSINIFGRSLGGFVSPEVDESDRDVQLGLLQGKYATLDQAIFDVALRRNYSWCALYKCLDPIALGGAGRTFRFYIFTLRNSNKNAVYAFENTSNFVTPQPLPVTDDRKFAVPWFVELAIPVIDFVNPPIPGYIDRFLVNPTVGSLLRTGSSIIDGDLIGDPSLGLPNVSWCGQRYEVVELIPQYSGNNLTGSNCIITSSK